MEEVTVAVTGACGQIAYQLIPSLLKGEVFGDKLINLHLVDIPGLEDKLNGVMMEIEDCAFEWLQSVHCYSSDLLDKAFHDIDFAFLIGAMPRTKGMERSDLLSRNGAIFKEQGEALSKFAKKSVKVLVVGNPCNTNCLIAAHHAKDIPNEQFFAMTMLDENRAKYQLAKRLGVHSSDVQQLFIYGNHSATQFPDFENSGMQVNVEDSWWYETYVPMIQNRGASVINARGASSAASAAHAAVQTARNLVLESPQPFSVAKYSKGEAGSPKGLIVSMPCYFEEGECMVDDQYAHSLEAQKLINLSYSELEEEFNQVKALGLLEIE